MLRENVDYMFIPNPEDDKHYAIKLLGGDYEGVEYYYTTISAKALEDRLEAVLSYTYKVLLDPGEIITNKKHFEQYIGDVLSAIIYAINSSDNPLEQMELHEQVRDDNSSELVEQ